MAAKLFFTLFKIVQLFFSMEQKNTYPSFTHWFESVAAKITRASGSPAVVLIAILLVILWGASAPVFNFSDNWLWFINTATSLITFVMVFIIQHSQNKDTTAVQLKLNELLAANKSASNRMVNIEDATEEELLVLKKYYKELSEISEKENNLFTSFSIEDGKENIELKKKDDK